MKSPPRTSSSPRPRLVAAGDLALLVVFEDAVLAQASRRALEFDRALQRRPVEGVVDVVPGLRSVLVCWSAETDGEAVRIEVEQALRLPPPRQRGAPRRREWEIPVAYGGVHGPDLAAVATECHLSPDEVVARHCSTTYTVAMLGNLPGLPYLLTLPPALSVPRRTDPRDHVAAGSVAIAGRMSCIYPVSGPGGWSLIGRTGMQLFDPGRADPFLLEPGDTVRFQPATTLDEQAATPVAGPHPPVGAVGLEVVAAGPMTTVQDAGRPGWRRFGIPTSGALDQETLWWLNRLCGNSAAAAGLEVTVAGPELRAHGARIQIGLGALQGCRVRCPDGTLTEVPPWSLLTLEPGEVLSCGRSADARAWLAVTGGIATPRALGSRSAYPRGLGRALAAGDLVPVEPAPHDAGRLRALPPPPPATTGPIRVVLGPQLREFSAATVQVLTGAEWTCSHRSDRVGVRLEGPPLPVRGAPEIDSDGCVPGSIQVAGGRAIVLLADGGTTGGYPKIATVATVDLGRLGRLRPGTLVRFEAVTTAVAEELRRQRTAQLTAALRPLR